MGYQDNFAVRINIDLENGVYLFVPESASGKTRLYFELKERSKLYDNVFAFTYNMNDSNLLYERVFTNKNCKVLMFDRYDMYNGMFADEICKAAKDKIILIDCKTAAIIPCRTDSCVIHNNKDEIEVTRLC